MEMKFTKNSRQEPHQGAKCASAGSGEWFINPHNAKCMATDEVHVESWLTFRVCIEV